MGGGKGDGGVMRIAFEFELKQISLLKFVSKMLNSGLVQNCSHFETF